MSGENPGTRIDNALRVVALADYRAGRPGPGPRNPHLRDCELAWVEQVDAENARCGEGTCEMVDIAATVRCPHGHRAEHTLTRSGHLDDLYDDIEQTLWLWSL